jgi:hypothetical protein
MKTIKGLGWVLPHPSTCLPCDTLMSIHGWPIHYPDVHPRGMVGYRPTLVTIEATQFAGPHKSRMCQYIINAYSVGPNRCTPWLTQAGATTFGASNMTTDLSPIFPYGILHFLLVAPPSLTLCHILKVKDINHIGHPSEERAVTRAIFDHSSSTDSLHN